MADLPCPRRAPALSLHNYALSALEPGWPPALHDAIERSAPWNHAKTFTSKLSPANSPPAATLLTRTTARLMFIIKVWVPQSKVSSKW